MIYVIGGIGIDIIVSKDKFIKNTSNIADLNISIGGVGFNIFKNINISEKCFISIIGNDISGKIILNNLKKEDKFNIFVNKVKNTKTNVQNYIKLNINKKTKLYKKPQIYLKCYDKKNTSFYNAFMQKGELLYGASNFEILEKHLDFDYVKSVLANLFPYDIVVIDSNLNPELIKLLLKFLENKKIFIFFETISIEKTKRIKNYLNNIFFTSPEINEFKVLLNIKNIIYFNIITKNVDKRIYRFLKNKKIKYILLTKGKKGSILYYIENNNLKKIRFQPNEKLKLKTTNGAGDYLFSKIIEYFNKLKNNDLDSIIISIKKSILETELFLKKINKSL